MRHWARSVIEDAVYGDDPPDNDIHCGLKRIIRQIESLDVHLFRTAELEDIANGLSDCIDLEDLSRLMWTAASSTGFENFIVFVINNGVNGTPKSRVCTSCNVDWITRYQEQNYQYIDPAMAEARRADGYFEFADLPASSPAVQAFWADAEDHRIGRQGLCFVSRRPGGARIGVSFLSGKSEDQARANVRRNGHDLMVISELAIDAFCYAAYGAGNADEELSVEELRFLYLLATSATPQDALNMPARYGSNKSLQASIRRKLGAQSVFQAVAIASSRGAFDDLPYDAAEVTRPFPELAGFEEAALKLSAPED